MRAVDLGFVEHDQMTRSKGRVADDPAGGGILLIKVRNALVVASIVRAVRRPEDRASMMGATITRRHDEFPEVRSFQYEGVSIRLRCRSPGASAEMKCARQEHTPELGEE